MVTGGDGSTVTGGDGSTVTGGEKSKLVLAWWDQEKNRSRTEVAYVGEKGIEPNVAYKLNKKHEFVKVGKS